MTLRQTSEIAMKNESTFRYWDILKSTARYVLSRTMIRKWRTDRIVLPGTSRVIYVNPTENRGRILYMTGGVTQPRLNLFWNQAVATFRPTLVVDVMSQLWRMPLLGNLSQELQTNWH
ncbi:hypothetical protein ACFPES_25725 [Paenibacillus sp. GCM10023248]|uniref:hypothetical protein n=1 Tax=unclassified Paenibacillus TaxID=185978 RepID=UPI00237907E1|nr:hypothetical protein [Paenibacillus sp. MAHUQ-63]MDD9270459.1 hypothetical protein [Paenibacillus sp. MAHUQ-63]